MHQYRRSFGRRQLIDSDIKYFKQILKYCENNLNPPNEICEDEKLINSLKNVIKFI